MRFVHTRLEATIGQLHETPVNENGCITIYRNTPASPGDDLGLGDTQKTESEET
jgi:hypothetical protein